MDIQRKRNTSLFFQSISLQYTNALPVYCATYLFTVLLTCLLCYSPVYYATWRMHTDVCTSLTQLVSCYQLFSRIVPSWIPQFPTFDLCFLVSHASLFHRHSRISGISSQLEELLCALHCTSCNCSTGCRSRISNMWLSVKIKIIDSSAPPRSLLVKCGVMGSTAGKTR